MKRLIIVGSPRSGGRSARLAEMLFEANIEERPEDELYLVPVSEVEVGPCIGCGACKQKTPVTFKRDDGEEVTEPRHRCVFDDDMQTLYDLLDEADELTVVSPVYFSGAPAPLKCVLDRMQPYFWVNQRGRTMVDDPLPGPAEKRPAALHVVGEGCDPHGFAPLVGEVKSSLACAGFRLERVMDWVGKIDESGEIIAEATEVGLGRQPEVGAQDLPSGARGGQDTHSSGAREGDGRGSARDDAREGGPKQRPKLDLSTNRPSSGGRASAAASRSGSAKAGAARGSRAGKSRADVASGNGSARKPGSSGGTRPKAVRAKSGNAASDKGKGKGKGGRRG